MVGVVECLATVFQVDTTIIALTFVSLCNSIGDIVSNLAVAKKHPSMVCLCVCVRACVCVCVCVCVREREKQAKQPCVSNCLIFGSPSSFLCSFFLFFQSIASCFGSPLLNTVLGLGISLVSYCSRYFPHTRVFHIDIDSNAFSKVKLAWVFMLVALGASLVCFPAFSFSPPPMYAYFLILVYIVFITCSVLLELDYFKI